MQQQQLLSISDSLRRCEDLILEIQSLEADVNTQQSKKKDIQELIEKSRKSQGIDVTQQKLQNLTNLIPKLEQQIVFLHEEIQNLTPTLQKISKAVKELEIEVQDKTKTLNKQMPQSSSSASPKTAKKMNHFRPNFWQFLNDLNRNKRDFSKLPIGPVGLLLTLKDTSLSPIIEKIMNISSESNSVKQNAMEDENEEEDEQEQQISLKNTFLLDSEEDLIKLQALLANYGLLNHFSLTVFPFSEEKYQIPDENIPGFTKICDNFEIDDKFLQDFYPKGFFDEKSQIFPTIFNFVVDQYQAETKFICKYPEIANFVMKIDEKPLPTSKTDKISDEEFEIIGKLQKIDKIETENISEIYLYTPMEKIGSVLTKEGNNFGFSVSELSCFFENSEENEENLKKIQKRRIETAQKSLAASKLDLKSKIESKKQIEQNISNLQQNLKENETDLHNSQNEIHNLDEKLEQWKESQKELFWRLESIDEIIDEKKTEISEKLKEYNELKTQ